MGHPPLLAGVIEYEARPSDPAVGTTVSVKREPAIDPEKCAGGAGSMEIGPTSIRYVPSASNVPSAWMIGRENWPCPHPTARLHPASVTDRQAPSPVHRPMARGSSAGLVGMRLHASMAPHPTSATTSTHAGCPFMPRYSAWRPPESKRDLSTRFRSPRRWRRRRLSSSTSRPDLASALFLSQ